MPSIFSRFAGDGGKTGPEKAPEGPRPPGTGADGDKGRPDDDSSVRLRALPDDDSSVRLRVLPDDESGRYEIATGWRGAPAPTPGTGLFAGRPNLERMWRLRNRFTYLPGGSREEAAYVRACLAGDAADVPLLLVESSEAVARALGDAAAQGWDVAAAAEIDPALTRLPEPSFIVRMVRGKTENVLLARLAPDHPDDRVRRKLLNTDYSWPAEPPLTPSAADAAEALLSGASGLGAESPLRWADVPRALFRTDRPHFLHYDPAVTHFRDRILREPHTTVGDACEASLEPRSGPGWIAVDPERGVRQRKRTERPRFLGKTLYLRPKDPKTFPPEFLAMFAGTWFFRAFCAQSEGSEKPETLLENVLDAPIPLPTETMRSLAQEYSKLAGAAPSKVEFHLNHQEAKARKSDPNASCAEDALLTAMSEPDLQHGIRTGSLRQVFGRIMGQVEKCKMVGAYELCAIAQGVLLESLLIDWLMELNGESINVYHWSNPERWPGDGAPKNVTFIEELRKKGFADIVEAADFVRRARNRSAHPTAMVIHPLYEDVGDEEPLPIDGPRAWPEKIAGISEKDLVTLCEQALAKIWKVRQDSRRGRSGKLRAEGERVEHTRVALLRHLEIRARRPDERTPRPSPRTPRPDAPQGPRP